MTNKMTKRDYYNALLAITDVASNTELVAFINHELELLDKKNKSNKGELTETQKENLEIAEKIVAYMGDKEVTIADIRKHFGLSSQKVTPIMTNLVNAGRVTKTTDKRTSYYKVA